jgi:lauroyl/myristoyl acyltransferase
METVLYFFARGLVALIQSLPLNVVARLGRAGGALAFWADARHRRVALENLQMCFGVEKSPDEIRGAAKENFRRIGENFACAVKTAAMTADELRPHIELAGFERLPPKTGDAPPQNVVGAIGHFGNFELYARVQDVYPHYQSATTYRALKQPAMNRLLQNLRGQNGCLFFERRAEGEKLRQAMNGGGVLLGLLADQSSRGLRALFLGHDCDTSLAPAVFALRYNARLFAPICYRVAPAKWRIEFGEEIQTHENGHRRSSEDIMRDVNRAFETAVRRDPANWFWVHRRWKAGESEVQSPKSKVESLGAGA